MGCCVLHTPLPADLSQEESSFLAHESQLGFPQIPVYHIAAVIAAHSDGGWLDHTSLRVVLAELGTARAGLGVEGSGVGGMYRELTGEGGGCEGKKIAVLGALLGKGSTRERAETLVDCVTEKGSDFITQDQAASLIDLILTISSSALPRLAQATPGQTPPPVNSFPKKHLDAYISTLTATKATLARRCTNLLMMGTGKVKKEEAYLAFQTNETLQSLLTPFAARQLLRRSDLSRKPPLPS